ncbi:hypothetical protein [Runella sp. SP2]|uniref:hypothetical protein n=1 Tax=Runella sp. SP2 TaxID=2268026 RepID=UPI000F08F60C|nr:hypothetical protein [Runella sp. SP2]AYQ31963.1 hypothetical protein DTQ70_07160 [Runella sp. SP2]
MITLTFTETVFWCLTLISLPCSFFFAVKFSYALSDIDKLKRRLETVSDYAEELSERLYKITEKEKED